MSGRILAGEFHHSVDLVDKQEWPESKWVARFTAPGVDATEAFMTKVEADAWVTDQVRAFLGGRTVIPAPDGDGVVVLPHALGGYTRDGRQALAVRVREASPLGRDLDVAADVVERIVTAERLLREVLDLTETSDDPAVVDFARLVHGARGKLITLREWSACDALEEQAVHLHRVEVEAPRHLALVPSAPAQGGVA